MYMNWGGVVECFETEVVRYVVFPDEIIHFVVTVVGYQVTVHRVIPK